MKIKNVQMIDVGDWDSFVAKTYGKPYSFQQQYSYQPRGVFHITIPTKYTEDEDMNDEIPFKMNGNEMGVKFQVWLDTSIEDINNKFEEVRGKPESYPRQNDTFWERNFYPDIHTLANDLHEKGLIEAGEYTINIDW